MKPIADWRQAWKMFSVQSMAIAAAVQAVVAARPDLVSNLPPGVVQYITLGILIFGVIGRLADQGIGSPEVEEPQPEFPAVEAPAEEVKAQSPKGTW